MLCKTHVGPHERRRKNKCEFSTEQTSAKFILQGSASARCCCDAERQQSPLLPRRRLGYCPAKLMLAITHANEKANANSALNKHTQNSSYKVQLIHAAVVMQSGSNRLRSLGADSVKALQNSRWSSRTPTKKQTRILEFSTKQTSAKFIFQGSAPPRCCCVAERQQSPSLPRRRLGCCAAKLMLAITHTDENNKSHKVQYLHLG
jgi:hypothetical protein